MCVVYVFVRAYVRACVRSWCVFVMFLCVCMYVFACVYNRKCELALPSPEASVSSSKQLSHLINQTATPVNDIVLIWRVL